MAFCTNNAYLAIEIATKAIEPAQAKQQRAAVSQRAVETKQLSLRYGAARLAVGAVLGEGVQKIIEWCQLLLVSTTPCFVYPDNIEGQRKGPGIEKQGRKVLLIARYTGGGAIPCRVLHRKWWLATCVAGNVYDIYSRHILDRPQITLHLFVGLGPVVELSAAVSLLILPLVLI